MQVVFLILVTLACYTLELFTWWSHRRRNIMKNGMSQPLKYGGASL